MRQYHLSHIENLDSISTTIDKLYILWENIIQMIMEKLLKLIVQLVFITTIKPTISIKPFNGNTTLDHWIYREICSIINVPNSKYSTILINIQTRSKLIPYISPHINCFNQVFVHKFSTIDKEQLYNLIDQKSEKIRFKKILIVINATMLQLKNEDRFFWLISVVDKLDNNCWNCLPPIITIDDQSFTKERLIQLSNQLISKTNKTFTSTIYHQSTSTIVHIRPILDGCYRNSSTMIPNSMKHFERLTISYKKCNLNQEILKISVLNQQPFCQILKIKTFNSTQTIFGPNFNLESNLIKLLAKRFNFRYKLSDDELWGIEYKEGKWTGNIGVVYSRVRINPI